MNSNDIIYALFVLLGKSGICLSYGVLYVIHSDIFPTSFLASSYGIANFICRGFGLLGPLVAEVENKMIPLYLLIALNLLGTISTLLIKMKNKEK